jgi:hypothetical protein
MGQGAGAFVTVGSLRVRRAPGQAGHPAHSASNRLAGGRRRRLPPIPFLFLVLFSSPSYTHRPWFTTPAAQRPSRAGFRIPRNDFVWGLVEMCSRPPNPSPGSHRMWGLGRVPAHGPTLHLSCPLRADLHYVRTYPIVSYPTATYPIAAYPTVTYPIVTHPALVSLDTARPTL